MALRDTAGQCQPVGLVNLITLPAAGRPVFHEPMQARQIECPSGWRTGVEPIDLGGDAIARGRQPFVPVGRLQASASLFEHEFRQAISKGTPGECSRCAIMEKLFRGHRQTVFEEPHVGGGVALVNMPTGEHAFVVIARIGS